MDEYNLAHRIEQHEKELHLTKHRLTTLEQEQLPRRVASMEPVVQRLEHKLDAIGTQIEEGLESLRAEIIAQKALQKGVVLAVAAVVGLIQLVPYLKGLMQ